MPPSLRIGLLLLFVTSATAAEKISFNRDVRPILSDICFQCHGPDEKKIHGGLQLHAREHALKAGESGETAIVPGKPELSELIKRVTSSDPETRMPPKSLGKDLSPRQIEILKQWVAEGAEFQGQWSFLPVKRPTVPAVQNAAWPRTSVDRFLLARLEREGLAPSPEASRETLIRRLSLDLIGLPPTPTEVDAFVNDKSSNAYEKVVDRLLASPHYGERAALPWLDFARYADSNGFQTDGSRYMWPWRDWVIRAYNDNLPFDQFTIEQLAGDLLPEPTQSQLIATGFNRNHRINGEGGIIAEEWRIENIIDRVETVGLTWMGLTLNCCRCHDHKYDPISQKDFYQLFAYFNNVPESGTITGPANRRGQNSDPVLRIIDSEQEAESAAWHAKIAAAEAALKSAKKDLPPQIAAWEAKVKADRGQTEVWLPFEPAKTTTVGGSKLTRQDDGTWLAGGKNPAHDVYTLEGPLAAGPLTGVKLETFPDASLPNESLGRYSNGNFVLSAVECEVTAPSLEKPLVAKIANVAASYSQKGWEINLLLDDSSKNGWAVDGPTRKDPTQAMFLFAAPLTVPADATLTVRLKHEALGQHNIGRFKLATTGRETSLVQLDGPGKLPEKIAAILDTPAAERKKPQVAELEKFYLASADSPLKKLEEEVAAAKKGLAEAEKDVPSVMIMREEAKPRDAFLLIRGQYDKKGDKVTMGLPKSLPPLPEGAPNNRLGLAKWLVDPSHPLTSRVWVNRAWERLFGTGIVKTSENLGSQAEFPVHPELLDWLAAEFMQPTELLAVNGVAARPWDMKAMIKLLVMSAAYRQSSRITPELLERDPENRLVARGPRFRLPGELVRDQALAASGLLAAKIGGPSVRPYMPDGVWDETSRYGDLRGYKADKGEGLYRRTMYTIWKRTAAPPTMLLFDAPNRETCSVKRSRTNTPLQALSLLNEVTFVEAARKLGERLLAEGGATTEERLTLGFRLVVARKPTANELAVLVAGLNDDLARFRADPEAAKKLAGFGDAPMRPGFDPVDVAAYALAANVLLNLDEVITRE